MALATACDDERPPEEPPRVERAPGEEHAPAEPVAEAPAPPPPDEVSAHHEDSAPEQPITAERVDEEPVLDGRLDEWTQTPFRLDRDYAGRSAGPETLVRVAWAADALFLAFDCAYEGELDLAESAEPGEIQNLYAHEVVELFVDPSPQSREGYREIEIDPRGRVLDIDVDLTRRPRGDTAWSSGVTAGAAIDQEAHRYRIEARIPAAAFDTERLAPGEWRVNVYRIAGRSPDRTFLARYPTHTERPNFHQPDRFGWLRLVQR